MKQRFKCILFIISFVILLFLVLVIFIHKNSHSPHMISSCLTNVKVLEMGVTNYWLNYGHLPQYGEVGSDKKSHSWRVMILPYIGHEELYRQYDFSEPWDGPNNKKIHDLMPNVFRCPLVRAQRDNCSSYMMVINPSIDSKLNPNSIFIIETNNTIHNWLDPTDFSFENFDLDPEKKNDNSQLRRLCKHYKKNGISKVYGTITNLNDCSCISEDSKPEALKALSDSEKRKMVKFIYPWGKDFGIQRAVIEACACPGHLTEPAPVPVQQLCQQPKNGGENAETGVKTNAEIDENRTEKGEAEE